MRSSTGTDGTDATSDDVTRSRCEGHVTAGRRPISATLRCWCVLVTLAAAAPPPVTSVEHRSWYPAPRLDVKVYPRHSELGAAQSVSIQCNVHSASRVHRSRPRVVFYVSILSINQSINQSINRSVRILNGLNNRHYYEDHHQEMLTREECLGMSAGTERSSGDAEILLYPPHTWTRSGPRPHLYMYKVEPSVMQRC